MHGAEEEDAVTERGESDCAVACSTALRPETRSAWVGFTSETCNHGTREVNAKSERVNNYLGRTLCTLAASNANCASTVV